MMELKMKLLKKFLKEVKKYFDEDEIEDGNEIMFDLKFFISSFLWKK